MALDTDKFTKLCNRLVSIGLDGDGPPELPADPEQAVKDAAKLLPLVFRTAYVDPLVAQLDSAAVQDPTTLETLGRGCVRSHNPTFGVSDQLHRFLAVVSDFYRSFLSARRRAIANFPIIEATLPPVATFKNTADFGPFTITAESVQRVIGAPIGVVSLPSVYRDNPLLWAALAHETGGHDVIHADLGLEPELAADVLSLFGVGDVQPGQSLSTKQLQGLLWSFWIDETAADIYGLLNIGPQFAVSLAALLTSLGGNVPHVRTSTGSNPDTGLLDEHPTDILRIHVAIGVIQSLRGLSVTTRQGYIDDLKALATLWRRIRARPRSSSRANCQFLRTPRPLPFRSTRAYRSRSCRTGRSRLGALIANTKPQALGGHNIQELETWDDLDEAAAQRIAAAFLAGTAVDDLGDDAQLLAGALIALTSDPDEYDQVTGLLNKALTVSFQRDPIWGPPIPDHFFVRSTLTKTPTPAASTSRSTKPKRLASELVDLSVETATCVAAPP